MMISDTVAALGRLLHHDLCWRTRVAFLSLTDCLAFA